ncbi:AAA family ATPase [Bacillus sp. AGMB 02131]|uniref:AAA family ATPase n=1 Tax=Peribacillus faecalis TaxID=2772559 RepID=A0A927D1K5_9BACI|nr:AAA family ATPase [Peribacillus faecalis]MBD3109815.1 AAA family ATPase [Peribacillus faecalis]
MDDFHALFIRGISLKGEKVPSFSAYPFHLPAVSALEELRFSQPVTFFVGENGSGKSTILEAIASSYGFNPEGGTRNFNFSSFQSHSNLDEYLTVIKGVFRPEDGFFLRAESFYNVASEIEKLDDDGKLIGSYGGISLHEQSHGESFMSLFLHKFKGNSLYILDEPEAALSPARQMTMIARMHELVLAGCQFIIATHSPIIMAYPEAEIYTLNEDGYTKMSYKETEHYQITKAFLNAPDRMLNILLEEEE